MKCDECQEREATVHDSAIRAGRIVERHLCETCAKKAGLNAASDMDAETLTALILAQTSAAEKAPPRETAPPKAPTKCPHCQLSFATFRQGGLLGCPECYATFEAQLAPMLQRYHEGAGRHAGKTPRRAGRADEHVAPAGSRVDTRGHARDLPPAGPPAPPGTPDSPSLLPARTPVPADSVSPQAKRLAVLRAQLAAAIRAEQYERAAHLRDELRALGDPHIAGPLGEPPEGPAR